MEDCASWNLGEVYVLSKVLFNAFVEQDISE